MVRSKEQQRVQILTTKMEEGDFAGALQEIDHLLQIFQETTRVAALFVIKGVCFRGLGLHSQSKSAFSKAAELAAERVEIQIVALFEEAQEALKLGQPGVAVLILTEGLRIAAGLRKTIDSPHVRGRRHRSIGDLAGWKPSLDPYQPESEVAARILLARAFAYRTAGQIEAALTDLRAILMDPFTPGFLRAGALLDSSVILFEHGDEENSKAHLLEVLVTKGASEKTQCDALYNLALISCERGEADMALRHGRIFILSELPPIKLKLQLAEPILESLSAANRWTDIQDLISLFPQAAMTFQLRVAMAISLAGMGRGRDAKQAFQEIGDSELQEHKDTLEKYTSRLGVSIGASPSEIRSLLGLNDLPDA